MSKKLAIVLGVATAVVALVVVCRFVTRPITDEERYRELCRFGSRYRAAWTGKLGFLEQVLEQVTAVSHLTSLTNYYRSRLEADSKALLASGCFVETSVPFPNLHAKQSQVLTILSKTHQTTGLYYEAKLNWPSNEVRLVCRKKDVSLWEQALRKAPE